MQKRAELVRAVEKAGSLAEQARLLDEIAKIDNGLRAQAAQDRELDFADTVVRDTLAPVRVHEHHTASTDWLGHEDTPDPMWQSRVVAEAASWYNRVPELVKQDADEFRIQAQGMARRVAGPYGLQAEAAQTAFLTYAQFLHQGASGLDQIQQTVNGDNQPATTPLPTEVFDNFAPEVDPINAGVSGTEDSNRAPLLQEILNGGSGADGGQPEKPGGHSEGNELSWAPPSGMQADTAPGWSDGDPGAPEQGGNRPDYTKAASLNFIPGMAISHVMNMDQYLAEQATARTASKAASLGKCVGCGTDLSVGNAADREGLVCKGCARTASRKSAAPNDPSQRMIDHMQAHGPHNEGYAYVRDGIMCPDCAKKSPYGEGEPISWSELRSKMPHGTTCDNCMRELTQERPHTEGECEYGEECPYGETHDANDSHVPEDQHHDWGGEDDFNTHLMGHQDWQSKLDQRDKDRPHLERSINDMFSGPEWNDAKGFMNGNPGGATHHSKRRQAASGLPMIQETVDANNQPHAPSPIPPAVAFPLDDDMQQQWTTNGTGNAQPGGAPKAARRKQADMFGNSDTPHAVVQPDVANTPATTPPTANNAGGAAAGAADASAGNAPTFADDSAGVPTPAEQYPAGYAASSGTTAPPQDIPASMAGPGNGVTHAGTKVSSLITTAAEREHADFRKGYGYATRWTPGTRLVSTGSKEFEAGLYAGISDNPGYQQAFVEAHRTAAQAFPGLGDRVTTHKRVTARVVAKNEVPSNGLYLVASTSIDLNTTAPGTTPAADGSTPINGPGKPAPLDGVQNAAAPGGPAPYNGAEPFGTPVVPGAGQAPETPNPADALTGGGGMSTNNQVMAAQTLAFRRRVQASLLASRQGK